MEKTIVISISQEIFLTRILNAEFQKLRDRIEHAHSHGSVKYSDIDYDICGSLIDKIRNAK